MYHFINMHDTQCNLEAGMIFCVYIPIYPMIAALDLQSTRLSRAMAAHNIISEIIHALHESVIYIW